MANKFLEQIIDYKVALNKSKSGLFYAMKERAKPIANPHRFRQALLQNGQISLIAEIKRASPSKGVIRPNFDALEIAQIYAQHKVNAISVVTEDKYFQGSPKLIGEISSKIDIPILTKDFIIDEGQIYEALGNGASAVLLIKAILDDAKLKCFMEISDTLGLDSLVEVHDGQELSAAVDAGAKIIGINNRDLQDFSVRMQTSESLIPKIPDSIVKIAESGYGSFEQVQKVKALGAHAVLIGETFMAADNIGNKIEEVMHGQG